MRFEAVVDMQDQRDISSLPSLNAMLAAATRLRDVREGVQYRGKDSFKSSSSTLLVSDVISVKSTELFVSVFFISGAACLCMTYLIFV